MFGFDFMFTIFPIVFIIIFVIVIGVFIKTAVKGATQYHKNNQSPVLTVDAAIVSKRTNVSTSMNHVDDSMMHSSSSTTYYVTFQVESGDRMEFVVNGSEFGMLAEGDTGKLTFQGTRYQGFTRVSR